MFRAPLCPSSGAREYYISGCCLSYLVLGFQVVGHTTLSSTPYRQRENQAPNTTGRNHLYNTLELLMMGIMVPETCWASNKICNKNHLLHLVGILLQHINDDARSKSLKILKKKIATFDSVSVVLRNNCVFWHATLCLLGEMCRSLQGIVVPSSSGRSSHRHQRVLNRDYDTNVTFRRVGSY